MTGDGEKRASVLGHFIRAALAIGLLGLAIQMNRAEISGVFKRKVDPSSFALGLFFYLSGLILAYLRWFMLVRAIGMSFRLRDALRLGYIGAFFNFVIPGAVFGNVVKAAFLCRERPEDRSRAIGSVVVDFLAGLIGLFLIAAIAGTIGRQSLVPGVQRLVVIAWAFVGLSAVAMLLAFRPRPSKRKPGAQAYRGRLDIVVVAIVMGTGTHALNVLAFHAVSVAMFGATMVPGLAEHLVIVPLVLFTTAVPLPFGALGVSEQASRALFSLVDNRGGAVAMLGFRVLMLVGAVIGAVVYMCNTREVRELAATTDPEVSENEAPGAL